MKLISNEEFVFIGPGSDWFWLAVSGVVLSVTFLAIYRQLRMARSASAREQIDSYHREWNGERMLRCRLDILVAIRDGVDRAHLPAGSAVTIENFWETIGSLGRSGHLDAKLIYDNYGTVIQGWWQTLAPHVQRSRAEADEPRVIEEFEWLAGAMDKIDRQTGVPLVDETRMGPLEERITRLQDQVRLEEALRTIVASPAALTIGQLQATPAPTPAVAEG